MIRALLERQKNYKKSIEKIIALKTAVLLQWLLKTVLVNLNHCFQFDLMIVIGA